MTEQIEKRINVAKVDEESLLVYGWGIISTKAGEPYFDLQHDNIPSDVMADAAADFMTHSRVAKVQHNGEQVGSVVFAMPLTKSVADAFGIECDTEGLMVAVRFPPEVIKAFSDGELTGYSIGGVLEEYEEVPRG